MDLQCNKLSIGLTKQLRSDENCISALPRSVPFTVPVPRAKLGSQFLLLVVLFPYALHLIRILVCLLLSIQVLLGDQRRHHRGQSSRFCRSGFSLKLAH